MVSVSRTVLWLAVLVTSVIFTESRDPVLHRVGGGKFTWRPNVNFTEWASHERFYVGDWLYFGFDKHLYDVLQVNKTNYEKCIGKDFIKNITRGGRDVFNLTEAKPYYFICGRGYNCRKEMKVALHAEDIPPPSPPIAAFYKTNSSSTAAASDLWLTILFLLLAYVGVFLPKII